MISRSPVGTVQKPPNNLEADPCFSGLETKDSVSQPASAGARTFASNQGGTNHFPAPAGNSGVAAINCRVYASRGFAQIASASPVSTSLPCSITAMRVLK
jgi:hypothetical protein